MHPATRTGVKPTDSNTRHDEIYSEANNNGRTPQPQQRTTKRKFNVGTNQEPNGEARPSTNNKNGTATMIAQIITAMQQTKTL